MDSMVDSVLFRNWQKACILSWLVFFVILALENRLNLINPVCGRLEDFGSGLGREIQCGILGALLASLCVTMMRVCQTSTSLNRIPSFICVNILTMGIDRKSVV